jgi:hypothetical protein
MSTEKQPVEIIQLAGGNTASVTEKEKKKREFVRVQSGLLRNFKAE